MPTYAAQRLLLEHGKQMLCVKLLPTITGVLCNGESSLLGGYESSVNELGS